jgi:hypothetical protein
VEGAVEAVGAADVAGVQPLAAGAGIDGHVSRRCR